MALKKNYLKGKNVCKVTFSLPKQAVKEGKKVFLVGEFNEWNGQATPMKKQKDGSYVATLELKTGREFQFRCIDGGIWENDYEADRYEFSPIANTDNSVVAV